MINNPLPEIPNLSVEMPKSQKKLITKKNTIIGVLFILLIVLIGTVIFLVWDKNNTKKMPAKTPIAEQTKVEEPAPVAPKGVEWLTYTDKEAGFSLKYPESVGLNNVDGSSGIHLNIAAEKLSAIPEDLPMFMGRIDALKVKARLEKEVGETDVNLGPINGATQMVLSQFEICSLILDRKLIFFPGEYRVILTLSAPQALVTTEMPEFFTKDSKNCGDNIMWNRDKFDSFEDVLEQKQGNGIAQTWYDMLDKIAKTIKITAISKPVTTTPAVPAPTYKNSKYGFGVSFEKPYRALEDKDSLGGYPNAVALIYGGGQAYDIVIEVWDTKAAYEKEHKARLADLTVHEVNGKFIVLINQTNESGNKKIIESFVEL